MTRTVASLLALTSIAAAALAAESPAFEVASIRAGQPGRESIEYVPEVSPCGTCV
jgi:hypothetical protein